MPSDREKQARIAALKAELAELEGGGERRPLTRAEIRKMTPEQAKAEWDRITASVPDNEEDEPAANEPAAKVEAGPPLVGASRLAAAYEAADVQRRQDAEAGR